ncbi:MAG: lipopolysaccharide biosynthesis protein [Muribaculum sp.]|nr:lipopolysaccharide biosynthesis protein [Muribaculum sp.]
MMAISLFTFRELIKLLGVDDYGIYNAIAGVVILFSFLSNAMIQANQRHLSYYIGQEEMFQLTKVFSMIFNVQVVTALVIIALAETIGLWFINNKMNFDGKSMIGVNIVYQFTILTFSIQLLQIPFTSAIISHEKMSFFSYASIGDAFLRLGTVLLLGAFAKNRLLWYVSFLSINALCIFLTYASFCMKHFNECRLRRIWDKELFNRLISFSGWNMIGGLGNVGASQGINILFNIFNGVIVNAAMGISHQISTAVNSLVSNMQTAFNPQIIKSYAAKDYSYFNSLIFRGARLSFCLITVVGIPIIVCAGDILRIWLTEVPEYAISFSQLTIAYSIIDSISGPLWTANQAYGKVKFYMVTVATITLLVIPISYFLLKHGLSPNLVMVARIVLGLIILTFRIVYLGKVIDFPVSKFFTEIVINALFMIILIILIYFVLSYSIHFQGILNIIILGGSMLCGSGVVGFFVMLNKIERDFIINKIQLAIKRR